MRGDEAIVTTTEARVPVGRKMPQNGNYVKTRNHRASGATMRVKPDDVSLAALATLNLPSVRQRMGELAEAQAREVWCSMLARHQAP